MPATTPLSTNSVSFSGTSCLPVTLLKTADSGLGGLLPAKSAL
jgi:hypothetical protein